MEIEKLIKHMREEAQDYRSGRTLGRAFADAEDVLDEAATALEQIQAENDRLKEEVQQMRWIPVEERLPSANDLVLVFSKDDEYGHTQHELAKYMFHPTLGWDWCTFDNEYYEWLPAFNRVTHWMPLPTLPKEENRESV